MARPIKNLKVLNNMLLIEPSAEENVTKAGVILVEKTVKRKPKFGIVKRVDINADPKVLTEGETVMYPHGMGTEVILQDEDGTDKTYEVVDTERIMLVL